MLSLIYKILGRSTDYIVQNDIANGREKNKIPAVSHNYKDRAPNDYHYVTEDVEATPMSVDRSLSIMNSCSCEDDCSGGQCKCTSTYNTVQCYRDGKLSPEYNLDQPEVIYECNIGCKCKQDCQNRVIQRGTNLRLILFRTQNRGWGIKTLRPIKKGTFIGVYSGELITTDESCKRQDDTYLFNLSFTKRTKNEQQFVCDAKFYGNFTRFINHSCQPNVIGIRSFTVHQDTKFPHIAFFALEKIGAQKELTLNYGDNYWLVKCKRDKQYCLCKHQICRFTKKTFPVTYKEALERRKKEEQRLREMGKEEDEEEVGEEEEEGEEGEEEEEEEEGEGEQVEDETKQDQEAFETDGQQVEAEQGELGEEIVETIVYEQQEEDYDDYATPCNQQQQQYESQHSEAASSTGEPINTGSEIEKQDNIDQGQHGYYNGNYHSMSSIEPIGQNELGSWQEEEASEKIAEVNEGSIKNSNSELEVATVGASQGDDSVSTNTTSANFNDINTDSNKDYEEEEDDQTTDDQQTLEDEGTDQSLDNEDITCTSSANTTTTNTNTETATTASTDNLSNQQVVLDSSDKPVLIDLNLGDLEEHTIITNNSKNQTEEPTKEGFEGTSFSSAE